MNHASRASLFWEWWWEIGAALLSVISMSLIATLLFYINDTPLKNWILPIQPNSLLAALTTIAKTALLVPVASCIGQLKWRHFAQHPRPLNQLQILDDASRGPWGSLILIYHFLFRVNALILIGLTVCSILALGIDPSAQQIIVFEPQEVKQASAEVTTSRASAYYSRRYDVAEQSQMNMTELSQLFPGVKLCMCVLKSCECKATKRYKQDNQQERTKDSLKLQASIYNALIGSIPQPFYTCPEPALSCAWDEFSTLGICSNFREITTSVTQNCSYENWIDDRYGTPENMTLMHCDLWYPGDGQDPPYSNTNPNPTPVTYFNSNLTGGLWTNAFSISRANTSASIGSIWITKVKAFEKSSETTNITNFESFVSDLFWCEKRFNGATASLQGMTSSLKNETAWAGLDGSGTSSQDPENLSAGGSLVAYLFNLDSSSPYNISTRTYYSMTKYLDLLMGANLNSDGFGDIISTDGGIVVSEPGITSSKFALSKFMWANDVEEFTHGLASLLNAQMLDPYGDNMNVTTISGYMVLNEIHIRVRWVWLTLPLFETLFTCVALAITIFLCWGQPLLKNSAIALLIYGLSGWSQEDLRMPMPKTSDELDKLAGLMTAQLGTDNGGSVRFIRYPRPNK
jgi:hypothetical protein